jgi:hypothetical protein
MLRVFGLTVSLLAGLTACQQPIAGLAGTHIETAALEVMRRRSNPIRNTF